jgi:effector-binding domain-containing protein
VGSRGTRRPYDPGVVVTVDLQTVSPRMVAAVRRAVRPAAVRSAWAPALDIVWPFLRSRPGLWHDGHNIFLYQEATQPDGLLRCDFGVEVTGPFDTVGEVHATETPAGDAVVALYRGPYEQMVEAYAAIDTWIAANDRESAGHWWEIYGDPMPDPGDTETTVVQLLT